MKTRIALAHLVIIAALTAVYFLVTPQIDLPGSTVKVIPSVGHGSGVHIGDGYIVTAAHVVNGERGVTLRLDDGTEQSATVLWSNVSYDVALLRTEPSMMPVALSCRVPERNEEVYLEGNPLQLEFIRTNGRIAGEAMSPPEWHSVVPVDSVIIMGMSGGPAFDTNGNVIGINVGVMVARSSLTGIGFVVPGQTICELLARS